jgi:hypothetical protein
VTDYNRTSVLRWFDVGSFRWIKKWVISNV